ncbi:MAG: trypsin-like peptidase domain-containing protein [Oscillospiraceae bacterium]|nr:trypsin-like peptidase domain-containing protein [Oscillospiraceae bacterium]
MDTRTLAMVNKPGVVLMYTQYTANVSWKEIDMENSYYYDLDEAVRSYISAGYIAESQYWEYMIYFMSAYMVEYAYYTGNVYSESMSIGFVGTGFIITPDGYMVTNAHVVMDDEEELKTYFIQSGLEREAIDFTNRFEADLRRDGYRMSDEEWYIIANAYYDLMTYSIELSSLSTDYYCFMGNVQPGADISTKGLRVDLRKVGVPSSSKDVAVMKLSGSNFPTVTLGDDNLLKTGDQVYAMGYPAIATLSGVVEAPQAMQEPTMTQGILSAKKTWYDGGSILQHDAAIDGGNSGGPLFNAAGEVVGVNTFKLRDATGATVAGMYFSVPISTVKTYLNELNITPSESKFTTDFKAALTAYNAGDYETAMNLLRAINDTNPGYPVVQELLAESRTAFDAKPKTPETTTSNDTTTPPPVDPIKEDVKTGAPIWLFVVIGVVVLGAAAAILLVVSKKKKASSAPAAAAQPQYPQPVAQYPQQAGPADAAQYQQYAPQQQYATPAQQQYAAPQPQPQYAPQQAEQAPAQYQHQQQYAQLPADPAPQQYAPPQEQAPLAYQQQPAAPADHAPQQYAPPQEQAPLAYQQPAAAQVFCTKCGAAMSPEVMFCSNCGTRRE